MFLKAALKLALLFVLQICPTLANNCGVPPDVENANCDVSGYTIGNWAYYTCDEGYILYGRNRILCTKNGWSKPSLFCQKIKCDHPPTISNGTVTQGEEWPYRAKASYYCDEGYTLTGEETISCMDTGAWSHPPPNCTEITCHHPPTISHGTVTQGEEWSYGAKASYYCEEGYTLTGEETISCMDTGAWSHPPPNCTEITCHHPPTISHGTVTQGEEWSYGAKASYYCEEGYTLTGEETIYCTDTGAWSHPPPICTVRAATKQFPMLVTIAEAGVVETETPEMYRYSLQHLQDEQEQNDSVGVDCKGF
ncbi:C4b-binding protein alpha chain-like [Hemitrygon akajei]|uniref:C4b-binding protein alpha chain-like n=1 Tax=Hemitrygon akajei TaxID=2704970 RepID=UPI003BF951D7